MGLRKTCFSGLPQFLLTVLCVVFQAHAAHAGGEVRSRPEGHLRRGQAEVRCDLVDALGEAIRKIA